MEITFNDSVAGGLGAQWKNKPDSGDSVINEMKKTHCKLYINRNWKCAKYKNIIKFMKKYNIELNEEQNKTFEEINNNTELNPIMNSEEILIRTSISNSSAHNPFSHFNPLLKETADYFDKQLDDEAYKILKEELKQKEDKCINCCNVYKTEEQKLMRCSNCRCKLFSYCSKRCQKEDWKTHKVFCNSIKEAVIKYKAQLKEKKEKTETEKNSNERKD